jgi:hypothetical protein
MANVVGCGNQDVAGHGDFATTAPDAAFEQGDDRRGEFLNRANQDTQRVSPAERVAAAVGQLADIVAGRPDLGGGGRPQYGGANVLFPKTLQRCGDFAYHRFAEGIAFLGVVHHHCSDGVSGFGQDERHGFSPKWERPWCH